MKQTDKLRQVDSKIETQYDDDKKLIRALEKMTLSAKEKLKIENLNLEEAVEQKHGSLSRVEDLLAEDVKKQDKLNQKRVDLVLDHANKKLSRSHKKLTEDRDSARADEKKLTEHVISQVEGIWKKFDEEKDCRDKGTKQLVNKINNKLSDLKDALLLQKKKRETTTRNLQELMLALDDNVTTMLENELATRNKVEKDVVTKIEAMAQRVAL